MEIFHFIQTLGALCKQNRTKALLISICAVGLATAGIQYYNEPLLAFGGMSEKNVNLVLVWQPMTALAVNVITGIAVDRTRREYMAACRSRNHIEPCVRLRIHNWSRAYGIPCSDGNPVGKYEQRILFPQRSSSI